MKKNASKGLKTLLTLAFASACLWLGYVAPHGRAALAQGPSPTPTGILTDSVPGGFNVLGPATISNVAVTQVGGSMAKDWGPCRKGQTCTLEFRFKTVAASATLPAAYTCPPKASCLSFTGKLGVHSTDENGDEHPPQPGPSETFEPRNVAGMVVLTK
jgi:hypothetical protein